MIRLRRILVINRPSTTRRSYTRPASWYRAHRPEADWRGWLERHTTTFRRAEEAPAERSSFVSALDRQLLDSVLRFLTATGSGVDRRVLAPIYLQEMVYRVLQREQFLASARARRQPDREQPAYRGDRLRPQQPLAATDRR